MVDLKAKLARLLRETKSFQINHERPFKLSSGVTSPYYVDCKALMGDPRALNVVGRLAYELITEIPFSIPEKRFCIGGLEIGAINISTAISGHAFRETGVVWPTFVVRKQAKEHGLEKRVEGPVQDGDAALIVDDVLTSGGSIIQAVKAAKLAGLSVSCALVVVDREEQRGRQKVESEGLRLISLLTIAELREQSDLALVTEQVSP